MKVAIVSIPMELIRSGDRERIYQEAIKSISKYNPEQTINSKKRFYEYLDKHNYRKSWERDIILNTVLSGSKVFTCKKVLNRLKERVETSSITLMTVNRTFKLLIKAEVIKKVNNNADGLFQTAYFELVV